MSLGEILVVILVAVIVTKPEDILTIIKKIQNFKLYCEKVQNQIFNCITENLKDDDDDSIDTILNANIDLLNFYLERIIKIQGYYDGPYSLDRLKAKHTELIEKKNNTSSTN